jgi:hypothetical protein
LEIVESVVVVVDGLAERFQPDKTPRQVKAFAFPVLLLNGTFGKCVAAHLQDEDTKRTLA